MRLYDTGKRDQVDGPWSKANTAGPDASTSAGLYSQVLDVRAVTPIYKGSAQPNGIDADYPFRGPALRGQLRSWWRAVQPTTSVDTLRAHEHRLFGGVFLEDKPRASRVSLGLSDMASTPAKKRDLLRLTGANYDYALWVDRGGEDDLYHVDALGKLRVSVAPLGDETLDFDAAEFARAVKALVLLGGSGSRSRRGMGRLWSDQLLGPQVENVSALQDLLNELAPPSAPRPWPSLAGARAAWKRGTTYGRPGQAVDAAPP
jgi:CRISPR-associated protein Cmr1